MNRKHMKSAVLFLLISSVMLTAVGAASTEITQTWDEKECDEVELLVDEVEPILLNVNGETYGCMIASLEQDIELDLIAAVGNNGVEGYVRSAEMDAATYRAPEERHIVQTEDVTIPLYDVDGVTIIDTFTITAPNGVTYE